MRKISIEEQKLLKKILTERRLQRVRLISQNPCASWISNQLTMKQIWKKSLRKQSRLFRMDLHGENVCYSLSYCLSRVCRILSDRFVDIAFGLKKVVVPFTIEDEKVPSTEIITEQIEEFDGVQSADVVSINKM